MGSKDSNHEFACENFLAACDGNEAGYRKWTNFLRQWYVHGPFVMDAATRAAAEGGRWEQVLDTEAVGVEAGLVPNVQAITDPREMVERGVWMRWETCPCDTGWRYPERVIGCHLLHEWYRPRLEGYPGFALPPDHIHLGIEHYSKGDVLAPYWVGGGSEREAYCPRCDAKLGGQPSECDNCGQRMGGYQTYSAKGWPRKAPGENSPPMPDEYSFYFLGAYVHAPADMRRMDMLVGADCRYQMWLNGCKAGRYIGDPRFARWDMDRYEVELQEGWNLLLVKLAHETVRQDYATFLGRFGKPDGEVVVVNDFAKEDIAPESDLRIAVSEPIAIGLGYRTPTMRRFPDGTLVCNNFKSVDNGARWVSCPCSLPLEKWGTWDEAGEGDVANWEARQDADTLILREFCSTIEPGLYGGKLCRSLDGWQSREVVDVSISIPDAYNLVDEGNVEIGPGLIMGLNIVGLANGDLLVPMYASLKQDVVWFDLRGFGGYLKYPQQWERQFKYRSWVLRSQDGGLTWQYLSTIAAFPELGRDEGPCEPNIELMPDGSLLAVLRNGGGDTGPLWITRSQDNGCTWSVPVRTTPTGNYPSLIRLSNGVLACLYGRPDSRVSFDLTGSGLAWSHNVVLFNGHSNDHVEGAEISSGELYCVYGDDQFDWQGERLSGGQVQWYGVRVKTERLR